MSNEQQSSGINWAHIFDEYWILMLFGTFFMMTMYLPILGIGLTTKGFEPLIIGSFSVIALTAVSILTFGLIRRNNAK